MTDEQKEQMGFLLADFKAAKDEISRRSNLQKVVLTLLVSFYAWFISNFGVSPIASDKIALLWLVVLLTYIFYEREAK
jgi:Ca2+/Na+ antiporter